MFKNLKLSEKRFPILLIGLISLFLIPTSSQVGRSFQINPVAEVLLLTSIFIYLSNKHRYLKWVCLLGLVIMLRTFIPLGDHQYERLVGFSYYLILFVLVGIEVFKDLVRLRTVTIQEIYGALAAYILIGFGGFFTNMLLYLFTTNPFCGMKETQSVFDQLMYFSFSTLITVGYGDIAPCNVVAAKFSMLLGMMGQFYIAVAIALLVGGFMMRRGSREVS